MVKSEMTCATEIVGSWVRLYKTHFYILTDVFIALFQSSLTTYCLTLSIYYCVGCVRIRREREMM